MRVTVDTDRCTGHAQCFTAGFAVYDLDDDGYCRIPTADVPAALEQQARDGAASCPEMAITVTA